MNRLDEIAARADAATEGPWVARTTGRAGGDHWYVCDDGQSVASIHASDGEDEDQREPDAEFIAHAREDVPALVAALRAVEAVCAAWTARGEHDMAYSKTIPDENIADVLLTDGADMVERARIISNTIREALGS